MIGHFGSAALFAAPLVVFTSENIHLSLGFFVLVTALSVARLPDQFENALDLPHRSYGHTLFFIAIVTLFSAGISDVVFSALSILDPSMRQMLPSVIGGAVFLGLFSHFAADIITEGYDYQVRLWYPLSGKGYQLHWTTADNFAWNFGLLLVGGGLQTVILLTSLLKVI